MKTLEFQTTFLGLTGAEPFPWQKALYDRFVSDEADIIPSSCNLPTGLGKTSVIAIWLIALANHPDKMPRRLVYVVNRRTVVDQTTYEVEKLRKNLAEAGIIEALENLCAIREKDESPLAISTLRGQFADNREWSADPCRPAVIIGTVDMIGSRLLFSGYGVGFKGKPLHAGFLGQDALLVHDEAHLEPAFQELLDAIVKEQKRCGEFKTFRVMELSATTRSNDKPFELTDQEKQSPATIPDPATEPVHHAWRRLNATKVIHLHAIADDKALPDEIVKLALEFMDSGRAILIFLRKLNDVDKVVKLLGKKVAYRQLTGTMRGLERDDLVKDPIFIRFLRPADRPKEIEPATGTVVLICTSAGEVGVNLSADHLVCDLSTFDSMAQRFGRVNRFGDQDDTQIHVVHPSRIEDKDEEVGRRRERTLDLLRQLSGDGSPRAIGKLDPEKRLEAFAPPPAILPVSDILFDSWALTTIRAKLPGRPPVEPFLHGISEWDPPQTQVAWREEVGILEGLLADQFEPDDIEEMLEDYPLKPHELLKDNSDRIFKQLEILAEDHAEARVWLIDPDGVVERFTIGELADKYRKDRINYRTILLQPGIGKLRNGMLDCGSKDAVDADDVADQWFADGEKTIRRRARQWDERTPPDKRMRLIRVIDTKPDAEEQGSGRRFWYWFELPKSADADGSKTAREPVWLVDHIGDVSRNADAIVTKLNVPADIAEAVCVAARFHDLGKRRKIWQRSIGNLNPEQWLAKSGARMKPIDHLTSYRHEFGSLLDIEAEPDFQSLNDHAKELALHLIATHHGRGRPHFPEEEAFDPEPNGKDVIATAVETPRRFARLQRQYGRWGLAYIESLLRAADYGASARPSKFVADAEAAP